MELQFDAQTIACLRTLACDVRNEEQTQEVKLSDAMPDIGKVLGVWGQVLLRSKEWRSGSAGITGGVMVWVLYAPEDGSAPRSVEAWIPFQMRWDLPESQHDGTLSAACLLRSIDARTVSARKLMVRCVVSVQTQLLEPGKQDYFVPKDIPGDVHLLRRSYPVCIPAEAGEKAFVLDEELVLPQSVCAAEKLISFQLRPELIDQKVMGDKAVFRGICVLHTLYRGIDERLHSWDFEIPFSQYTELEREFGSGSSVRVIPVVTSLELEKDEEDRLRLKAGIAGQYVVYDRPVIELVADAYSNLRAVKPHMDNLLLPAVLDMKRETLHAEQNTAMQTQEVVDAAFFLGHPTVRHGTDSVSAEQSCTWQLLGYDQQGNVQSAAPRWDGVWEMPASEGEKVCIWASPSGTAQQTTGTVRSDVMLDVLTCAAEGIPMVTGMELGEMTEPDPGRPSLVLRRASKGNLWELAKEHGSTVDAILRANGLQSEPEPGRMLLIPIA